MTTKTITDPMDPIREGKRAWEEGPLAASLRASPERRPEFRTSSGDEMQRLYTPADVPPADYAEALGFPGEPPYTRGVQPTMYRGRFWTMRQYAGFGTAAETNRRFRFLLEQGQTGLSCAFDLPTQMGMDPDAPLALGEVGKVGVSISTLEDMETLLQEIPLDRVSISMTINATAMILLGLVLTVAKRRGTPWAKLSGTVQNDILKEYIARGTYIYPPEPSLRVATDIFDFCAREVPRWNTISVSGYHIREAGSSAAQELAFTFANAIAYTEAAIRRGLDPNVFCERMSFFWNSHNHFLEEVAKFRAARRIWSRILRERFSVRNPRALACRFHVQTAGSTLTREQPDVNVVRVALQALAAVLGGCQSLHTNSRDEALGLPTEAAASLALRTQQVIAHESGVADTVDPLGGSWAVESLTGGLEEGARAYLARIDEMGGTLAALSRGFQEKEIHETAYRTQMEIEAGDRVVVGVNRFQAKEEEPIPILRVSPALEKEQRKRLAAARARRDGRAAGKACLALEDVARGTGNLMPPVLDAIEAGATLGEISDALRRVFGEHRARG